MTLTFKVATQMLLASRRLNMVIISLQWFYNGTSKTNLWAGLNFAASHAMALNFKVATQKLLASRRLNMVVISVQ